jgi:2,3-bisphosphoglycerate-dependent phosphoglycerate mutase
MTTKIILLRHGLSVWNAEKKFTGWVDVALAPEGEEEARRAGELIKKSGIEIDLAYSSVLQRAKNTMEIVLEILGKQNIPQFFSWRLNERHYGALQGLNKVEMAEKYGAEQVKLWRRSYSTRPPLLSPDDPTAPKNLVEYKDVDPKDLPLGESLQDCEKRVMPLWNDEILSKIKDGKNILIALSGNSGRAIIKHLDNISDEEISELNFPTGEPLVYEFDENGKQIKHYYLSTDEEIKAKIESLK